MTGNQETLDYLDEVARKLNKLNMKIDTIFVIDEDRIVRKVSDKLRRGLSGRTTEGIL